MNDEDWSSKTGIEDCPMDVIDCIAKRLPNPVDQVSLPRGVSRVRAKDPRTYPNVEITNCAILLLYAHFASNYAKQGPMA